MCAALRDAGYEVLGVDREPCDHQADLTDEAAVASVFAGLRERLDLVVYAAGISGRRFGDGPVESIPRSGLGRDARRNLTSVFLVSKRAVPAPAGMAVGGAIVTSLPCSASSAATRDFATHAYAAPRARLSLSPARWPSPTRRSGSAVNVVAPA